MFSSTLSVGEGIPKLRFINLTGFGNLSGFFSGARRHSPTPFWNKEKSFRFATLLIQHFLDFTFRYTAHGHNLNFLPGRSG